MHNLYFACIDCKIYVDAGHRWAMWSLEETGLVARGQPVAVAAVLAAESYWTPGRAASADWLRNEVLPAVRCFLHHHRRHPIVFGNTADFLSFDRENYLDWMQLGFAPQLLPRYFAEYLGLMKWEEVCGFIAGQEAPPWWWLLEWENLHDKMRQKFEQVVAAKSRNHHPPCLRSKACGDAP